MESGKQDLVELKQAIKTVGDAKWEKHKIEGIAFTLGIPSKGRLSQPSIEILRKIGYTIPENGRCLVQRVADDLELYYLRAADIPLYISEGVVDAGITGLDVSLESGLNVKEVLDLGFGVCDFVLAGKPNKKLQDGSRIGTSFPNLTLNWLSSTGKICDIISVSGSVELLPKLNVSDFVTDLSSTGATLRENNLEVKETILSSTTRLFCKKFSPRVMLFAEKLKEALEW